MVPVTIHYPELPATEPSSTRIPQADEAHFVETFNRALRLSAGSDVVACDLHLGVRTQPVEYRDAEGNVTSSQAGGWLEHIIVVRYKRLSNESPRSLTVGAIQRQPGKKSEFVS
jgi:hypothetical protein